MQCIVVCGWSGLCAVNHWTVVSSFPSSCSHHASLHRHILCDTRTTNIKAFNYFLVQDKYKTLNLKCQNRIECYATVFGRHGYS